MTNPNWDEAPEGAQRYNPALSCPWLKKDAVGKIWFYGSLSKAWMPLDDRFSDEACFNEAITRPNEQGGEIERLKAELVEATEMALGQAKTLIERDKQIDELKTESKILETTIQELRGTDWAAVNIESQKRIAELESRVTTHDLIEFCAIKQDEYRKKNSLKAAWNFAVLMDAIKEAVSLREGENL